MMSPQARDGRHDCLGGPDENASEVQEHRDTRTVRGMLKLDQKERAESR
jgi:hypothetical protein